MKVCKGRYYLASSLALLVLALVACGSQSGDSETPANSRTPRDSNRASVADFRVSTGPDSSFALSEHRGEVVVLYSRSLADRHVGWRLQPWVGYRRSSANEASL